MADDLISFLGTIGMVHGLEPDRIRALAGVCEERHYPAGARLLEQGAPNATLYFLRTGALAVRTARGRERITVAHLEPPAVAGEVSCITGGRCSADIDVVIDATVVALPLAALAGLPAVRSHLFSGLLPVLAERLHATVTGRVGPPPWPVVLLRPSPAFQDPRRCALALARGLARELATDVLVVLLDGSLADAPQKAGEGVFLAGASGRRAGPLRSSLAPLLSDAAGRFGAAVLVAGPGLDDTEIGARETHQAWLLGPHEEPPPAARPEHFVLQDMRGMALPSLSARWRYVRVDDDAAPAGDDSWQSVARGIAGRQVGLALGGGGAWGWAHVGVLEVLEQAAIPVDAIAGCSMGGVIGGLRASGASIADLCALAAFWRRNHWKWLELRPWRLHVASERRLTRAFRRVMGERRLECFATPFGANAIDIETGEEIVLDRGPLVEVARASMAFPGWTPPVAREGRLLVDAAFIDPVPSALVKTMGCHHVIGVNTLGQMMGGRLHRRLPRQAYEVWDRYVRMAAHEIGRVHGEVAADVMITPAVGHTTMLSFGRADELIDAGRRAAEDRLPRILEVIAARVTTLDAALEAPPP